jgi:hypothetical protein
LSSKEGLRLWVTGNKDAALGLDVQREDLDFEGARGRVRPAESIMVRLP